MNATCERPKQKETSAKKEETRTSRMMRLQQDFWYGIQLEILRRTKPGMVSLDKLY